MNDFFHEGVFEAFASNLISVTGGRAVTTPVLKVSLARNDKLDLVLELTSDAPKSLLDTETRAGTITAATDTIRFKHLAGWTAAARGVVWHNASSRHSSAGCETVDIFTAHAIDIDLKRKEPTAHIVEWVTNVEDDSAWPEVVRMKVDETFELLAGKDETALNIRLTARSPRSNRALYLEIGGACLYVLRPLDRTRRQAGDAHIVYLNPCDETVRDKIRLCLSFVLGKPIVHLGTTSYCQQWQATFMSSFDAFTFNGAAHTIIGIPPYPITDAASSSLVDQVKIGQIAGRLLESFDRLDLTEFSWNYWYAVCAPLHSASVHFGALIERLQQLSGQMTTEARCLVDPQTWHQIQSLLANYLDNADLDPTIRPILEGKISSLNTAPAGLALTRVFDALGLELGTVEKKAWQERNRAAHGGPSQKHSEIILHVRLLRLMAHRLLAATTRCSEYYVDYYSLDFPFRRVSNAIPAR